MVAYVVGIVHMIRAAYSAQRSGTVNRSGLGDLFARSMNEAAGTAFTSKVIQQKVGLTNEEVRGGTDRMGMADD